MSYFNFNDELQKIIKQCSPSAEANKLEARKMVNDGTVRALIGNGDYTEVGYGVIIQKTFGDEKTWTVRGGGYNSQATTGSLTIHTDAYNEAENVAKEIMTLCRRKFKKDDIILCSVDSFYCMKSGIVFLEDRICTFYGGKLEYVITYDEMEEIDFSDYAVIITGKDGDKVDIYCGDEEEYCKNIFNLLMDIKESL